ncbi:HepT-like ribonuclease domain-containing protein [Stenoxybacter acetivorans]|uniref:HepT-like ribonuclease domain-containing protein n=1 Tax=Stenoxybacter acetivorans TaxID=422441 RepID=UPI00055D213B|nr:DUF86 domain-containing protein [Stenoxybacter acetivorans]
MKENRAVDYLGYMKDAAFRAVSFIEGLTETDFMEDERTQQAVAMSLVVIGESAARICEQCPEFIAKYPEIPWQAMRGMRNRIAHGYFEINFHTVWETTVQNLPDLLQKLEQITAQTQERDDDYEIER